MQNFTLKDSGKREDFATGSRRDVREGKGRFDLISPYFLRRLALVLERGAAKYGERNWEKGQPLGRYLDSALRHINAVRLGEKDEDHLAQAAWNLHSLLHTAELIEQGKLPHDLDDIGYCSPQSDVAGEAAEADDSPHPEGCQCRLCYGDCDDSPQYVPAGYKPPPAPPATSGAEQQAYQPPLSELACTIRRHLRLTGPRPVGRIFQVYVDAGHLPSAIHYALRELGVRIGRHNGECCYILPEPQESKKHG